MNEDLLVVKMRHSGCRVLCRGRFADPTFAVDCDFPRHDAVSFKSVEVAVSGIALTTSNSPAVIGTLQDGERRTVCPESVIRYTRMDCTTRAKSSLQNAIPSAIRCQERRGYAN
jgi:hypothetical protein